MKQTITRRAVLKSLSALTLLPAGLAVFAADATTARTLDVYKDPSCGCCASWIQHMQEHGFASTVHHPADLNATKLQLGVPTPLQSCHTAVTSDGFVFEGHVPAKTIGEFLAAPPENALGLAAPGMPMGSPGMEMGGRFTPYDVMLLRKDGSSAVYAHISTAQQQY